MKQITWPQGFDITTIMALPVLIIRSPNSTTRNGATCLLQITASECTFLLWKTHCCRLFEANNGMPPNSQGIRNQMRAILNERLECNCILMNWKRCQNKTLPDNLILRT